MRLNLRTIITLNCFVFYCVCCWNVLAQNTVNDREHIKTLQHGIFQFNNGHYAQSAHSFDKYLNTHVLPTEGFTDPSIITSDREKAYYYLVLSNLKAEYNNAEKEIEDYIAMTVNPVYRQRAAFTLAQYYFQKNNLSPAIYYYELAGVANLNNDEIADSKFELAYSYFNELKFELAHPLFASIKDLPDNKYYVPGNYYYGLLSYNNKNYDDALKSFAKIHNLPEYKDIVPYYEAEIYYFMGNSDKVVQIANRYLRGKEKLHYNKEMHLLRGQTLFEQKKFEEALPDFEYYYHNSEKIRKEVFYELAYIYYRLSQWDKAIETFKPLSNAQDSLGQTAMYLLGDCYLKTDDKKGARNAFGICSEMDFNPSQKEAAHYLHAKLSYELGDEGVATRNFYSFVSDYPNSQYLGESKTMLTSLLAKSSNYGEAFSIISDMAVKDDATWSIYQQVALARALQLLQNNQIVSADSVLSLSLQQPINPLYEAIAYFWKGEIAYREQRFPQAVQFSNTFITKAKGEEPLIQKINTAATVQNAYLNIGYANIQLGNYNDAQVAFDAAQSRKGVGYSEVLAGDATLRMADALFMQKDFNKAFQLYTQSIAADVGNPDYARYQMALILGLQGKVNDKIASLNQIVHKNPSSSYKHEAQYELAVTYLEQSRVAESINSLKELEQSAEVGEELKSKSLLKLGYAYQTQGQLGNAIATYQKFIELYPFSSDRNAAIESIRNLYILSGKPDMFAEFIRENEIPSLDSSVLESTYYEAADEDYSNKRWQNAASAYEKYLELFPKGSYAIKANYYRAESYREQKEDDKALLAYEHVVNGGWSDFAEDASLKAAQIAMSKKEYDHALKYYSFLRNYSMGNEMLQKAYTGLTQASFESGKYGDANAFADTLLSLPEINEATSNSILLYKAKALQKTERYHEAIDQYKIIASKNIGSSSAEAKYRIAEIYASQKKYADAEQQAEYAIQTSTGQDYWIVKNYILLSDILKEQKDYFNAKATLQSIIRNAQNKELKEEARQKLKNVIELEKRVSKLEEE